MKIQEDWFRVDSKYYFKTMPIILVWNYGHYIIMCKRTRFTSYQVHEATSEAFL